MPHYLIQLDDRRPNANQFAIYSTIVDGLLSQPMPAEEVPAYLSGHERDYSSWLTPYDPEETVRLYAHGNEGMARLYRDQARFFYWHPVGFCYAKLSDAYFCLPRGDWRNGR